MFYLKVALEHKNTLEHKNSDAGDTDMPKRSYKVANQVGEELNILI